MPSSGGVVASAADGCIQRGASQKTDGSKKADGGDTLTLPTRQIRRHDGVVLRILEGNGGLFREIINVMLLQGKLEFSMENEPVNNVTGGLLQLLSKLAKPSKLQQGYATLLSLAAEQGPRPTMSPHPKVHRADKFVHCEAVDLYQMLGLQ